MGMSPARTYCFRLRREQVFMSLWLMLASALPAQAQVTDGNVPVPLALDQAIAQVLAHNVQLEVSRQEISIVQAEQQQAGLWPNPEFSVEVEGFGGSGPWGGFDGAETTLVVSQPIETGGKRAKRQRVTGARLQQAEFSHAGQKQRLRAQATQAFYAVLAAQEGLTLTQQNLELSQRLAQTVTRRVAAGKDSPIKETQALITVSEQRMALQQADVTLSAARQHLATHWGSTEPHFGPLQGDFFEIALPPPLAQVLAQWEAHPATRQWQATVSEAKAALDLAKAEPIPDITVLGGYKRLEDVGQNTAVLGLALPLPLYHRNQGAKTKATLTLGRMRRLQQQAKVILIAGLKTRHQFLAAAATQARELQEEILPRVEEAYNASVTAYEQGKFDYLEILEAQRSLFETKQHVLDALAKYHTAQAALEELMLPSLTENPSRNQDPTASPEENKDD